MRIRKSICFILSLLAMTLVAGLPGPATAGAGPPCPPGDRCPPPDVTADPRLPASPPTEFKVTAKTETSVTFTWKDSTTNEDSFWIYRRTKFGQEPERLEQVVSLSPGGTFRRYSHTIKIGRGVACYQIRATNSHGSSPPSRELCVTVTRPPRPCSDKKMREVRAEATDSAPSVKIDCDLTLNSSDVISKRLVLSGPSATGVTVDCNGATINGGEGTYNEGADMIEVRSKKMGAWTWARPENITIKNCNIVGSIRVKGMYPLGSNVLRVSSIGSGHVARVRNAAPRNIVLDNLIITGVGRTPLYLCPGVTYTKLINSVIKGRSELVAIYLEAESMGNTIKNNYIDVKTYDNDREVLAIDASSHNIIMNNTFKGLGHGGIYLYRNCGEDGRIRHSIPSHNQIVNNIFYYKSYKGGNPSVYLGSRNGHPGKGLHILHDLHLTGYCDDDDGYPYGSSVSDLDYARYNVVMQNQIFKRSISDMIKVNNPSVNSPNYIDYNETVTEETVDRNRLAGCYVPLGYKNFVLHGESIYVLDDPNGEPTCPGYEYTCNDGQLVRSGSSTCEIRQVSFDCGVSGSNDGCQSLAACPSGQRIVGAKAACNLEWGAVSSSDLASVPPNEIKVVKASKHVSDGHCYVGSTSLKSGQKAIDGIDSLDRWVSVGCEEHDKNGGDCHISGILYCR